MIEEVNLLDTKTLPVVFPASEEFVAVPAPV